ncbi:MAG: excalibur calcium-binding domain-containing protein [Propionibacteriaceae bacterium]|nr:excalibur calcium-binding domain-containing protein [Propionibacteriaceae bacterium]
MLEPTPKSPTLGLIVLGGVALAVFIAGFLFGSCRPTQSAPAHTVTATRTARAVTTVTATAWATATVTAPMELALPFDDLPGAPRLVDLDPEPISWDEPTWSFDSKSAPTPAPSATPVFYTTCSEARLAGVAPIRSDEAGYRPGLDTDHDGLACE